MTSRGVIYAALQTVQPVFQLKSNFENAEIIPAE